MKRKTRRATMEDSSESDGEIDLADSSDAEESEDACGSRSAGTERFVQV